MSDINQLIAQGGSLGGVQLENPINALSKVMQLRGLQQQNQTYEDQRAAAQQEVQNTNALNELYKQNIGTDGQLNRQGFLQGVAQRGQGSKIAGYMKDFAAQDEARFKADKAGTDAFEVAKKSHRDGLIGVTTPEGFFNWVEAGYKDPVLGPALLARGETPETSKARAMQALQNGVPLNTLLMQSALGMDKFTEQNKPHFVEQDNGGVKQILAIPGTGATAVPVAGSQVTKVASPEALLTDARQRAATAQAERHFNATEGRLKANAAATGADGSYSDKPLPPAALKLQQDAIEKANIASNTNKNLASFEKKITDGKLDFGAFSNAKNSALNAIGISTEESRNFGTFKNTLEKLRNDSLRLNAGVQTDGDAQRAWNELFTNINDKNYVLQRLADIREINTQAEALHRNAVDVIRQNYRLPPLAASLTGATAPETPKPGQLPRTPTPAASGWGKAVAQ